MALTVYRIGRRAKRLRELLAPEKRSRHTAAALIGDRAAMNIAPAVVISLAILGLMDGPAAARAAPVAPPASMAEEASSAMGACLAAVIDDAPVADMRRGTISIHREGTPNLCIVRATGGAPADLRAAVMRAVDARKERFAPTRTQWDAGPFASREAFCNANVPGRRNFNVLVETGRAGAAITLSASVLETAARDDRCDLDYGAQSGSGQTP